MKTYTVQKQNVRDDFQLKEINEELQNISDLLSKVLKEIEITKSKGKTVRLTPKTRRSIDKGLRELKEGKYNTYKDITEFRKALA